VEEGEDEGSRVCRQLDEERGDGTLTQQACRPLQHLPVSTLNINLQEGNDNPLRTDTTRQASREVIDGDGRHGEPARRRVSAAPDLGEPEAIGAHLASPAPRLWLHYAVTLVCCCCLYNVPSSRGVAESPREVEAPGEARVDLDGDDGVAGLGVEGQGGKVANVRSNIEADGQCARRSRLPPECSKGEGGGEGRHVAGERECARVERIVGGKHGREQRAFIGCPWVPRSV
jgi:hypothetical protein